MTGNGSYSPQCIESYAVCNSKMPAGTDSVICPEFGTEHRWGCHGRTQLSAGLSSITSNPTTIVAQKSRKFSPKNERLCGVDGVERRRPRK